VPALRRGGREPGVSLPQHSARAGADPRGRHGSTPAGGETFHAQNPGNMHLHVSSLSLVRGAGGRPGVCRTRGFSLDPCREELSLLPGEQRRVVVAFTQTWLPL